jgi:hypothetical protein
MYTRVTDVKGRVVGYVTDEMGYGWMAIPVQAIIGHAGKDLVLSRNAKALLTRHNNTDAAAMYLLENHSYKAKKSKPQQTPEEGVAKPRRSMPTEEDLANPNLSILDFAPTQEEIANFFSQATIDNKYKAFDALPDVNVPPGGLCREVVLPGQPPVNNVISSSKAEAVDVTAKLAENGEPCYEAFLKWYDLNKGDKQAYTTGGYVYDEGNIP